MRFKTAARVILIGAPGVGKGTQTERLLKRFPQLQSISTGDLLRSHVKKKTPLGEHICGISLRAGYADGVFDERTYADLVWPGIQAESTIKTGGLVADDLMLRLISNELHTRGWFFGQGRPNIMTLSSEATNADRPDDSSSPSTYYDQTPAFETVIPTPLVPPQASQAPPPRQASASEDPTASFILDGYPRTAPQASTLDSIVPINLAVSLLTPFDVMLRRIAGRWVHEPSGRVYNTTFNRPRVPGRDDLTGEPLVQRADDTEEVYRTRYRKFQQTSEPMLEHYARQGVLIEVEGMSSDEISPKLFAEFEKRFMS